MLKGTQYEGQPPYLVTLAEILALVDDPGDDATEGPTSCGTCHSSSSTRKASCSATSASSRCCSARRRSAAIHGPDWSAIAGPDICLPGTEADFLADATLLDLDYLEVDPSAIDFFPRST